ncbi:MAG: hypothetical protein ACI4NM_06975 [Bullifex sp.]
MDFLWDILSLNRTREEKTEVLRRTLGCPDESLETGVSILCDYASMAVNRGIEQGIEKGAIPGNIEPFISVLEDKMVSLDYALMKTGLTESAFLHAVNLRKCGKLNVDSLGEVYGYLILPVCCFFPAVYVCHAIIGI